MLTRWFDFFKKDNSESYYKLGGPRSFYKYKYHNTNIILIGEVHQNMPAPQEREFTALFSQFIEKSNNVKILLEDDGDKPDKNDGDVGFITCLLNLESIGHTGIIKSDKRAFPDGLVEFWLFLQWLGEIEKRLYEQHKKLGIKLVSPYPCFKNEEFLQVLRDRVNRITSKFTFSDWYQFLESQVNSIDALADRYSPENRHLKDFLGQCVLGVNEGYEFTFAFEKQYEELEFNSENMMDRTLADVCVEMMIKEGRFESGANCLNAIYAYCDNYLNGTLACDIWNEIKNNDCDEKTLIVVTGNAHTKILALLMNDLCEVVVEVPSDKSGKIISVQQMDEYLYDDFRHLPSKSMCSMM